MPQCQTPFYVTRNDLVISKVPVPCGRCPNCVARYASGWSFRLMQEEKRSSSALFLTLTYESQHLKRTSNGYRTLVKSDVQNFIKRLRFAATGSGPSPIRYYAVGEYGSINQRPHYHLILFNAPLQHIDPSWSMGSIYYGDVGPASVGYCLKYLMKKGQIPMHARDDRQPEFSVMSKKLGSNYLTPQMVQWHLNDIDNRLYATTLDNYKITLPRYYKDRIFTDVYFETQDYANLIRKRAGMKALADLRYRSIQEDNQQMELGMDPAFNQVEADLASFREMQVRATLGTSL